MTKITQAEKHDVQIDKNLKMIRENPEHIFVNWEEIRKTQELIKMLRRKTKP